MARPNKPWFRQQTGWWMCTFQGKKRKLARGIENRELATKRFHQLMALKDEQPVDAGNVNRFCKAFLRWSERHHAPDTYRNHRFYIQSFSDRWGRLPVLKLTKRHVARWLEAKAWNQTSQYNGARFVFRVFNWAVERGRLSENPLKGMKRPAPAPRQRMMTREEYRALLRASCGAFKRFLFALYNTGARPAEVRRLRWEQVQDTVWVLKEHKTAQKVGKPRLVHLNVPMQKMMPVLRAKSQSPFVFVNTRGKPWTTNAVRLQIGRLRKRLGLADDLCAYLARHAFGTNAILRGVDVATAAHLLGHNSLEMIQKVYCHLADQHEHLHQAVEKITRVPKPATAVQP